MKVDENKNVVVDEDNVTLGSYEAAAKALKNADTALKALDEQVDSWTKGTKDNGLLIDSSTNAHLKKDTEMWKGVLDLTNSDSVIRKVLAGKVSAEGIKDATKDLDTIYEKGVVSYGDKAKKLLAEKYTSLHKDTTLPIGIRLETAYENALKVFGYDATKNEDTNLTEDYVAWFKCESYTSIDSYFNAVAKFLDETNKSTVGTISSTDTNQKDYAALLLALMDKGVDVSAYVTTSGDTVKEVLQGILDA